MAGGDMGAAERRIADDRRALYAFDEAVEGLAEEAGFLAAGPNRQAARYVEHATSVLAEVRTTAHRLAAAGDDPMLRKSARRRMRALARSVADAGQRDAEHIARGVAHLRVDGDAAPGWGGALRTQAARAAAWGVEKWTGSPLATAELRSPRAAAEADRTALAISERGRAPVRPRARTWIAIGLSAAGAAAVGASLAVYGAWSLVGVLFGAG
ncbi:hypothetical protein [Microbacterium sp. NPDC055683]